MKRFIALLLALVLMFSGLTGFGVEEAKAAEVEHVEAYHVNPRYVDVFDGEIESIVPAYTVMALEEPEYTTDVNVIAGQIREAMLKREASVMVYYKTDADLGDKFLGPWMDAAFEDLSNPKGGDYLAWHYGGASAGGTVSFDSKGNYCYALTISITYYTTAEQEAELEVEADKVLKDIGVSNSLSDYENLKKIYDYMCENIVYDYTNLNDSSYKLKYTAYAALIHKTSVCQGYANLFYYMARKSGLDVRIVAGLGNGGPHGWNIAEVDGWYYNLDATWDAGRNKYSYFLVGSDNFTDHVSDDEMYDSNYWKLHPLSKVNYDVSNPQTPPSKVCDLSKAKLMTADGKEFVMQNFVYDESAKIQQGFVVCDENGDVIDSSNYSISYTNNVNPGTATLTITAKGSNSVGSFSKTFEILRKEDSSQGKWIKDRIGYWYQRADGTYPQNGWEKIGDDWYYFNASGYRVTGWIKDGGVWYYLMEKGNRPETEGMENPDEGKMVHGAWFADKDGKRYYFQENGAMTTGWMYYRDAWYYLNTDGSLQIGWKKIGGTWYCFEEFGKMMTGWQSIDGTWYYFNGSGAMVVGWKSLGGAWYYFNTSGAMAKGWQPIGGRWYYFEASGVMVANRWVGNYYLQADGSMAVNKRIGIYYVGANGAWIPGR